MSKQKEQRRSEAKRKLREMALIPRTKKCPSCGKSMVHTRWCNKCKKKKRLKSKANSRGRPKDSYLVEN